MKPIVVLPTYNERDNLLPIVDAILSTDPRLHVLIVDDGSPDGTGTIADQLCRRSSRVHVMHRTGKRGRGYAGLDGFRAALESGYDVVLEMDADFSHPPSALPKFLDAIAEADVVVGSRFLPGARVRQGVVRRALSGAANAYIAAMLKLPVRDASSGFRAYRAESLRALPLSEMRSSGPSVLQEVLLACARRGFRIREIPVDYDRRLYGRSKLGPLQLIDSMLKIPRFKLRSRA